MKKHKKCTKTKKRTDYFDEQSVLFQFFSYLIHITK